MEKLETLSVEKPWGRTDLPEIFENPAQRQIGEIWYQGRAGDQLPLLIKYIFTSDRLSIQVHPNDEQARQSGYTRGKEEAWYVLDCEPDARLGIGLIRPLSAEELRTAALDGSLEALIDWKPVKPGDCYFIPAGTVHAIGAGITLAEVQQNCDITYRLFDYGRPRELHLDAGVKVSDLNPYTREPVEAPLGGNAELVSATEAPFSLDLRVWNAGDALTLAVDGLLWFIPLSGSGMIGGQPWVKGECWLLDGDADIVVDDAASILLATVQAAA